MEAQGKNNQPPPPSTKVERKVVEKNRRNQMKTLYSKLNSLLPNHNPQEILPLPDQIDQAINYIQSLKEKVEMAREKKASLTGSKRSHASSSTSGAIEKNKTVARSPEIEIRKVGSFLEIVLITGLDNQFVFYEIIRILHEENVQVVSANSSLAGDSMHHVVHAEIGQSSFQFGATKVSERLKRFVYGSSSDVEINPELWDFDIASEPWGF
ncbi:transcription factor bHLH162-like [Prosopis cineraria]|uniref:transcription factor bHLH162-like n=1 Tax=Prosopis cineraria TaxID=364024 RepID=UPI00240EABF2|nr:transcription factor bHLH162-like [Prosopis cineraria]